MRCVRRTVDAVQFADLTDPLIVNMNFHLNPP